MKKKLLVILAIVFAQNAFADKVSFYCRSEMMPSYKGYSKSYIQSVGCMDLQRGPIGKSARETAERHCQLWANGLELTKYTTKIFSEQDDGPNYGALCKSENSLINAKLIKAKFNKVVAFSENNVYAGGSNIAWTNLYIDNLNNQKILYKKDGNEQAQWIKVNQKMYCGFIEADIAFSTKGDTFEVIRPSTREAGFFQFNKLSKNYDAISSLPGLDADSIEYKLIQYGVSYVRFSRMYGAAPQMIKEFQLFYVENTSDCF